MSVLPPSAVIRRASSDDLVAYAAICRRTFVETFGHAHTAEDVAAHVAAKYSDDLLRRELCDPNRIVLAVTDGGVWMAYAMMLVASETPEVTAARPAEISRFYVDKPWHGRGVAQALMAESLAALRAAGRDTVWLGVWEHNPRAIAFYERSGFRIVGRHIYDFAGHHENDHLMAIAL
jgi:diamine N-acetyltransferase